MDRGGFKKMIARVAGSVDGEVIPEALEVFIEFRLPDAVFVHGHVHHTGRSLVIFAGIEIELYKLGAGRKDPERSGGAVFGEVGPEGLGGIQLAKPAIEGAKAAQARGGNLEVIHPADVDGLGGNDKGGVGLIGQHISDGDNLSAGIAQAVPRRVEGALSPLKLDPDGPGAAKFGFHRRRGDVRKQHKVTAFFIGCPGRRLQPGTIVDAVFELGSRGESSIVRIGNRQHPAVFFNVR